MTDEPSRTKTESAHESHDTAPADAELREKVREITARVLSGHLDAETIEQTLRSAMGADEAAPAPSAAEIRRALSDAVADLDEALMEAAQASHEALRTVAERRGEFTDNDLKEAYSQLQALHETYVRVVGRMAEATSGGLQEEFKDLAAHAGRVGADAGVRAAGEVADLVRRFNAGYRETTTGGLEAARDYGERMSMMASGVLAGVADALRDQAKKPPED